jgi:hypothetical protein
MIAFQDTLVCRPGLHQDQGQDACQGDLVRTEFFP